MATTLSYLSKNSVDDDDPVSTLGTPTQAVTLPHISLLQYRRSRVSPPSTVSTSSSSSTGTSSLETSSSLSAASRDTPAILLNFPELEARPKVFEETPEWAKRVKPFDEIFTCPIKTVKRRRRMMKIIRCQ